MLARLLSFSLASLRRVLSLLFTCCIVSGKKRWCDLIHRRTEERPLRKGTRKRLSKIESLASIADVAPMVFLISIQLSLSHFLLRFLS